MTKSNLLPCKLKRRFFFSFILIFATLSSLLTSFVSAHPNRIRVALLLHANLFQASSPDTLNVYAGGRKIFSGKTIYFQALYNRLLVNGKKISHRSVFVNSNSPFSFNGRYYKGSLQVLLIHHSLDAINLISLQKYLESVVGSEMPSKWPLQALEAQAVAARTYALREIEAHKNSPYDLVSSYLAQAYNGLESVTPKTIQAVQQTRGEVLTYHGNLIMAYYSSDCGGRTESGADIFHKNIPYLKSVPCAYDQGAPYRRWQTTDTLSELSNIFGSKIKGLKAVKDPKTEHVIEIILETNKGEMRIPGYQFRKIMGVNEIRSTLFSIRIHHKIAYHPELEALPSKKVVQLVPIKTYVPIPVNDISGTGTSMNNQTQQNNRLFILDGSGKISSTKVTKQNPLVLITAGGWLSGGYKNLSYLFVKNKLTPKNKMEEKTVEVSQGEKVAWIPQKVPNLVTFSGRGWGHGLGLCQWGARGMAKLGKNYRQILHFFYHHVKIQKW